MFQSSSTLRSGQTYRIFDLDTRNTFTINGDDVIFDFPVSGEFKAKYDRISNSIARGETTLFGRSDISEIFQPIIGNKYRAKIVIGNNVYNVNIGVASKTVTTLIETYYDNSTQYLYVEANTVYEAIPHKYKINERMFIDHKYGKQIGSISDIYENRLMFPRRTYDIKLINDIVIRCKTIEMEYESPILVEVPSDVRGFDKGYYFLLDDNKIQAAEKQRYKCDCSDLYKYFVNLNVYALTY